MENFDCCKFGIDKIQREKRAADAAGALIKEMGDVINALKNKKREFPSGGVVNESAQGEYIVQRPNKARKKYVVKKQFEKAASKIVCGGPLASPIVIWVPSIAEKALKEYGVFDLFCEEVKEEWQEPNMYTWGKDIAGGVNKKIKLLVRMQSWADFHNKVDGYVADWANDCQAKWGVVVGKDAPCVDYASHRNPLLFQISVGSRERAIEMHDYFKAEIDELIQLKMI